MAEGWETDTLADEWPIEANHLCMTKRHANNLYWAVCHRLHLIPQTWEQVIRANYYGQCPPWFEPDPGEVTYQWGGVRRLMDAVDRMAPYFCNPVNLIRYSKYTLHSHANKAFTGTVWVTNGSFDVFGTGTEFASELSVMMSGNIKIPDLMIFDDESGNLRLYVLEITDDTHAKFGMYPAQILYRWMSATNGSPSLSGSSADFAIGDGVVAYGSMTTLAAFAGFVAAIPDATHLTLDRNWGMSTGSYQCAPSTPYTGTTQEGITIHAGLDSEDWTYDYHYEAWDGYKPASAMPVWGTGFPTCAHRTWHPNDIYRKLVKLNTLWLRVDNRDPWTVSQRWNPRAVAGDNQWQAAWNEAFADGYVQATYEATGASQWSPVGGTNAWFSVLAPDYGRALDAGELAGATVRKTQIRLEGYVISTDLSVPIVGPEGDVAVVVYGTNTAPTFGNNNMGTYPNALGTSDGYAHGATNFGPEVIDLGSTYYRYLRVAPPSVIAVTSELNIPYRKTAGLFYEPNGWYLAQGVTMDFLPL